MSTPEEDKSDARVRNVLHRDSSVPYSSSARHTSHLRLGGSVGSSFIARRMALSRPFAKSDVACRSACARTRSVLCCGKPGRRLVTLAWAYAAACRALVRHNEHYLPVEVQQRLLEAADHRCAYCHTTQFTSDYPMVIDHIVPWSQGGETVLANLCYACHRCNEFKGPTTRLADPLTGAIVPLFHPRQHHWTEHFAWEAAGIRLVGPTAMGRVTMIALNMNNAVIMEAQQRWVSVGWHPPER